VLLDPEVTGNLQALREHIQSLLKLGIVLRQRLDVRIMAVFYPLNVIIKDAVGAVSGRKLAPQLLHRWIMLVLQNHRQRRHGSSHGKLKVGRKANTGLKS
jgi:hypothetical protein